MAGVRVICVLLVVLSAGCASTSGRKWFNPVTWFTESEARKVEKLETKRDKIEAEQIHSAALESFKTLAALENPSLEPARKIEVGSRLAQNTFGLLNQVSPLSFGEMDEARGLVGGLLLDLAEAKERQQEAEQGYARAGDELAETRGKLRDATKAAQDEAQENARLANELKTERLVKWAGWAGNGLLLIAVFAYRNNLLGLSTGLASGLAKIQKKYGAEDEDVLALKSEIDSAITPSLQNKILNKVIRNL